MYIKHNSFFLIPLFLIAMSSYGQRRLFIAAGQSNSVGMADSSLSVIVPKGQAYEFKYNNCQLVPLKDPVGEARLNFEPAHTGSLWPSFARSYFALCSREVVIIPAARGGSSCSRMAELGNMGTWDSAGKIPLLAGAVRKAKSAELLLHQSVNGIIWLQGERDANAIFAKQVTAKEYAACLISVIRRFRKGLGYQVPFYIVLTGNQRGKEPAGNEMVRQEQRKVAEDIPAVYIVYQNTPYFEKLHLMKDFVHYNQKALNQMGKEIAQKIYSLESVK